MKLYKYNQEDDLWCEYGTAYGAIIDFIKNTYPDNDKSRWSFQRAYVNWHSKEYFVSASFTRYDYELKDIVMLSCNAEASQDDKKVKVTCGERIPVEFDAWTKEYKTKK